MLNPKVSVCVNTYNQEGYIGTCIESLVTQQTNFDFEILVSDDCSTDSTGEIVKEYARLYPDIIKIVSPEKNLGASGNYYYTHEKARGEYIAHMDGDDYALPGKLQAQNDFLDAHTEYGIVWHRVMADFGKNIPLKEDKIKLSLIPEKGFNRQLILSLVSIGAHSSKMYRRTMKEFQRPPFNSLDYLINVEQIGDKYATFVSDKIYGVYRVGIGMASDSDTTRRMLCESFLYLQKRYPQYRMYINSACLMLFLADAKNRRKSALLFLKAFIQTFHYKSIFISIQNWNIYMMLGYK
jgi:glycosyltransferase involved in cell wall biosynthesis